MKRKISAFLLGMICISGSFAQGYYLEFKMTMGASAGASTMKTYFQDGNTRTEVAIATGGFNKTIITLLLKATPDKIYMLSPEQKTYDEMDISKKEGMGEGEPGDYQVAVLGKEKVNGYNTTHVKVLNLKDSSQEELWTSTELQGYADYEKIKTKYTGKENLTKALAAKGAMGFPVRIKAVERMGTIQLDLVKASKQNNEASLFSLNGYSKSATGGDLQQMMQKIQNMTPEERQKFIEQMKQQQGQVR